MTDTQPNIESMKATDTDLLLQFIKDWKAKRAHLDKCIDEAEKIVRERVGDLARPPSPENANPSDKPKYPRDPWHETPPVSPWIQPGPFDPSPYIPRSPWVPPIIWC